MKKTQTNPGIAKRALSSHAWLGLLASALMYLICLSGTIAVFHHEFERWEQPEVTEVADVNIDAIETAYDSFIERYPEDTSHYHVVFPTSGIPRVVMENDHIAHFVEPDGSLSQQEQVHWTKMLVNLHLYLHLPETFGMIFVSAFGALLATLIFSGLLAHPRIIKDAFRWRRGGTGLQSNIDIHNRLSVWATPFHLMIAVTGAYFGIAGVLITIVAQAFYDGDQDSVIAKAFAPEPVLEQPLLRPNIGKAIADVKKRSPDGKLIFLTVHEPHTAGQFIEIYVQQPQRLIYSENYRYDVQGSFIERSGYSDGETGRQIIYSIYRLHFGDFAGLPSKILYFILGMMLTVISATGINIWLAKRKSKDALNLLWPATVWGFPVALCTSAIVDLFLYAYSAWALWFSFSILLLVSFKYREPSQMKLHYKKLLLVSICTLVLVYSIKFGTAAFSLAAMQLNIPLLIFAALLWISTSKVDTKQEMKNVEN